MDQKILKDLKEIKDGIWEISRDFRKGMLVPVRIVATQKILETIDDGALKQAINVSYLPGIVKASFLMPDAHWGYGFPIGGVAAFDLEKGVISPGGIGFDINCGMRLILTDLDVKKIRPLIKNLIEALFEAIPAGVGVIGRIKLKKDEFFEVLKKGAKWAIENGFGWEEDIKNIEEEGRIDGADPENVSDKAIKRGIGQLGTIGSGNHYLEIQEVREIFDTNMAEKLGVTKRGQVVIMFHCGSRGFGHQVGSDYLSLFESAMKKYGIDVPDIQLACVPFKTPEGQRYFSAMAAAANNAFCNRQIITYQIRKVFEDFFKSDAKSLGMRLVYDVSHNIAKIEEHIVDARRVKVLVHRKGATRAFPFQPVILGGSMETGSYLLLGTRLAMEETFGSTAHGSGRVLSRTKAKKLIKGKDLEERMKKKGIYVKTASYSGLAEEAGFAYKDINMVIEALYRAGISTPIAYLSPLGNIKG